jgi:hypothetical protein
MNLQDRGTHRVSFHYWRWTARPFPLCLAVVGEVFVLTSPFTERDYRNVEICHVKLRGHIPRIRNWYR